MDWSSPRNYPACLGRATLKPREKVACETLNDVKLPCLFRQGHIEASVDTKQKPENSQLPCLFRQGHIEAYHCHHFFCSAVSDYPACLGRATLKQGYGSCNWCVW